MSSDPTRKKIPAWTTFLGLGLFVLAFFWLRHVLAEYRLQDIIDRLYAIPTTSILSALLLAAAGYSVLTLYEVLGLRYAGARIGYARAALTSFMAYGIGHSVGMNTLSGGAIRYRYYSALGLKPAQIATVVAFGTFTFGLGAALLLGISLLTQAGVSGSVLHLPESVAVTSGFVLLAGVASYLLLTFREDRFLQWRRLRIKLPSTRFALAQLAVACTDLLLASSVLYVLLPRHSSVSFLAFAGMYLISIAAGVVSTVPGGVGVFESVMLILVPSVPPDRLLGALLGYRAIYYLLPFLAASVLLALQELWIHRAPISRAIRLGRSWLTAVTPQAAAIAVFLAGAILLFSAATPALQARLERLREFVPLPILELSNLLGSAVGVGLLVLANGLYKRLDAAWWLTIWLLSAGVVLSLLKGFDYEEATILAIVGGILMSAHSRFNRRASLIDQRFSGPWILAVIAVLGVAAWLVALSYRHVPYANDLWWQFAIEAEAPRSLRALLVAALLAAAYGLWRLLRPAPPTIIAVTEADYARANALIAANEDSTANLALLGDKNLMFDESGAAFIMYEISGSSWVSMGDPIGSPPVREQVAWKFLEECDRVAASPVFYQVSGDNLALYVDLGLSLVKLGEEARVELAEFSLEGSERADLRQSHRRALRDGAQFEIVPREQVRAIIPELQAISDAWLAEKNTAEKGFSLGFFDPDYLVQFDCAVVRSAGAICAFANIWKAGDHVELSVDLMRHRELAPKGVIDFLLIECMLWGKGQGFRWFNLGMAPLSGLEVHALAPAWHKLGRLVQRYGENFYNFEGLHKYKEKFRPIWRPRYLAAPGGFAMAGVLLDVAALISGGVTKVLRK